MGRRYDGGVTLYAVWRVAFVWRTSASCSSASTVGRSSRGRRRRVVPEADDAADAEVLVRRAPCVAGRLAHLGVPVQDPHATRERRTFERQPRDLRHHARDRHRPPGLVAVDTERPEHLGRLARRAHRDHVTRLGDGYEPAEGTVGPRALADREERRREQQRCPRRRPRPPPGRVPGPGADRGARRSASSGAHVHERQRPVEQHRRREPGERGQCQRHREARAPHHAQPSIASPRPAPRRPPPPRTAGGRRRCCW